MLVQGRRHGIKHRYAMYTLAVFAGRDARHNASSIAEGFQSKGGGLAPGYSLDQNARFPIG
jgi:hypothetical protein